MKLVTLQNGTPDGALHVVSRDGTRVADATDIAPNLITALEAWDTLAPALQDRFAALQSGTITGAPFDPARAMAPLPRARGWLDASAFLHHGRLMERAFNTPPIPDFDSVPVVYQGGSDDLQGPCTPVPFPAEEDQIDLEGEFGVILGEVAMGTTTDEARSAIKLLVQLNDWSLRRLAPYEMKRGFGWIQAKPATSFAPFAITPDEIGDAWRDARIHLDLHVAVNGQSIGHPNGGAMQFGFDRLVAHCAATRRLSAGTILGSGTVSNDDDRVGSTCLSEVRVLEILRDGAPKTPFLSYGDRVTMSARDTAGATPFGTMDQVVAKAG